MWRAVADSWAAVSSKRVWARLIYWTSVYGSINSVSWELIPVFYNIVTKFVKDALFILSDWRVFTKSNTLAKTRMSRRVTIAEENEKAEWRHLFTVTPNTIKLSCAFLLAVGPNPWHLYTFSEARKFGQRLCVNPIPLCTV